MFTVALSGCGYGFQRGLNWLALLVGPARLRRLFHHVDKLHQVAHVHHAVRDIRGHRRGDAKALLDAAEIVMEEIDRQRERVVFRLL